VVKEMGNGAAEIHEALIRCRIDMITSVPCINLKELLDLVRTDPTIEYVPVSREEEGVGICAGAYLGGMRPAILMQNSGLGNSINALASLDLLYGIPLLMVISHRGVEGEQMIAQVPMGQLTEPLLRTMKITYYVPLAGHAIETIDQAWREAESTCRPVAVLLKPSFWR
jgi:sulfopyruvate decarboxylase subunit alpha